MDLQKTNNVPETFKLKKQENIVELLFIQTQQGRVTNKLLAYEEGSLFEAINGKIKIDLKDGHLILSEKKFWREIAILSGINLVSKKSIT